MIDECRASHVLADVQTGQGERPGQLLALVFSDDPSADLGVLTSQRCQGALPFAGKYRLIDFALSNCVNSGIDTVGVILQYQPRSLQLHLAYGRPWGLDQRRAGLTLLHPYQARSGLAWYTGTADALYQNQEFIFDYRADHVLVLGGSDVYLLDFGVVAAQHRLTGADLTVAAVAVENGAADQHHTLVVDQEGWVRQWVPPRSGAPGRLAVMNVLLFSADTLSWRLGEDAQQVSSAHSILDDVIPHMIRSGDRVRVFEHRRYWRAVRSAYNYWQAHMDLASKGPDLNLQDGAWTVRTQASVWPPTHVAAGATVSNSLLSEGCIVHGTVERSILSPGVYVAPGAVVRNAVVMQGTIIEECARVENAILDMDVIVGSRAQVGQVRRLPPRWNAFAPDQLIVLGRGTRIPASGEAEPAAQDIGSRLPVQRLGVPDTQIRAVQMG